MVRVLVAGSRNFDAHYRLDRAFRRVSKNIPYRDMTVITLGRRSRNGAEYAARELADAFSWNLERAGSVSEANADVCLAFLCVDDPPDDRATITAKKAAKVKIPVWRYYE